MLGWQDDRALTEVLAKKDAAAFKRAFGYTTCGELLSHYPRDYIRHNKDVGLGGAEDGDHVTITGVIEEARVSTPLKPWCLSSTWITESKPPSLTRTTSSACWAEVCASCSPAS